MCGKWNFRHKLKEEKKPKWNQLPKSKNKHYFIFQKVVYRNYFCRFSLAFCHDYIKRLPPRQETRVQSLGREDPLVKEMATHSSILAWRIPWMEETGRLQSMGSQRVRHDWAMTRSYNNKKKKKNPKQWEVTISTLPFLKFREFWKKSNSFHVSIIRFLSWVIFRDWEAN